MNMKEYTHKISAELLHEAAQFAATNDVRYYLNGVHIRKSSKGVIAEATNGHMCAIILDNSGEAKTEASVIISIAIVKMLPKKGNVYIHADNSVSFDNLLEKTLFIQLRFENALLDGKYPDINRVIPKAEDMKPGLNYSSWSTPYLLKAFNFFSKIHRNQQWCGVEIYQNGDQASAVFMSPAHDKIVIVMPQIKNSNGYKIPSWLSV